MTQFLLDTDTCIFTLRGKFNLNEKIDAVGLRNCRVSEITVAELKYGAQKSDRPEKYHWQTERFCAKFTILPITEVLDVFASEKARLEKLGSRLDDFDLLIGATAIRYGLVLVTDNVRHFERMQGLSVESWTTQ